ncbi:MAG: tetratricopeptide repeat protein, partial [Phycisphaerae bacterium]
MPRKRKADSPSVTTVQGRPFVGRHEELDQFDRILRSRKGEAVVVTGHAGMGKTMLVDRFAILARNHPDLKCGAVRYEVTPTDSPATTMTLMIDHAYEAAKLVQGSAAPTERRTKQWEALIKIFPRGAALVDLINALAIDPKRNTREQFIERLQLISERLPDDGRALFIVDPEKYMQEHSADDWRLVVRSLPDKIKLVFAQRPEDVLMSNEDFMALDNVLRLPDDRLDVLDDQAVDDLLQARATDVKVSTELREALARYEGHPYAIAAALNLIADGEAIGDLPPDPTRERIAAAQWNRVCNEHGEQAMALFEAYAVLEVAVPDDAVEPVSGLAPASRKALFANAFLGGLLREDQDGRRIYHALLADHIRSQLSDDEAKTYHRRAVDIYRKRLHADTKPDALAATRLSEHVLIAEGPKAFLRSFVNEGTPPLLSLGLLDAALSLSHKALSEHAGSGTEDEAIVRGNLGVIYRARGDLDQAEDMYRKSLAITEKLDLLELTANQYGNLGLIYRTRGDLDQAEKMHRKSLAINEKLGRLEGMAMDYGNLGLIYRTRGDLDQAEKMHRKSLAIEEKLGRLEGMAIQYGNLGTVYEQR